MVSPLGHIGQLEIRPIRQAFPHEALHFTTWMSGHIDLLNERLGLKLSVVRREQQVGSFNVDLLCEDASGQKVIVENQLEMTDHDHLGKVLTYLVNLEASSAVWVVADVRPEHEKVVEWLNETTPETLSFYLVKAEAVRIGDSPYAPLFTVIAGPDSQIKTAGSNKKDWADRHFRRERFWKQLLDYSKGKTPLFSSITPGRQNWISTGAGRTGFAYQYVANQDHASVLLCIDPDSDPEKTRAAFDALALQKVDIERDFGGELSWTRSVPPRRACFTSSEFAGTGTFSPESQWPELHRQMVDAMVRLERATRQRVSKLSY